MLSRGRGVIVNVASQLGQQLIRRPVKLKATRHVCNRIILRHLLGHKPPVLLAEIEHHLRGNAESIAKRLRYRDLPSFRHNRFHFKPFHRDRC